MAWASCPWTHHMCFQLLYTLDQSKHASKLHIIVSDWNTYVQIWNYFRPGHKPLVLDDMYLPSTAPSQHTVGLLLVYTVYPQGPCLLLYTNTLRQVWASSPHTANCRITLSWSDNQSVIFSPLLCNPNNVTCTLDNRLCGHTMGV